MNKQPFFSVCIPNFNYGGYIAETVQSVLDQTFQDFEIIIVDNASTDNSWDVIRQLEKKDTRIRIFRNNANIGFAPNLQRATEKATGKFINLLSSDDIMYANALETYYNVIVKNDSKKIILHSAYNLIDAKSVPFKSCFRLADKLDSHLSGPQASLPLEDLRVDVHDPAKVLRYGLTKNSSIGAFCTIVYSREIWEEVEGYDPSYLISPDKGFLIKALAVSSSYIYVNKRLYGYRIHNNNQISKSTKQAVLKLQIDGYIRAFSLSESILSKVNVKRSEVEKRFIDFICMDFAFAAIKEGRFTKSLRIVLFSIAAYPKKVFQNRKFYALLFIFVLSPLLKPLLFVYNKVR
jgi:glycosyltransferase involved in cell wall biosynthesis